MKGGKFEEKSMGPMFPRLHVNDAERGGPRAPPRNKMALYEQLTIPSNRYSYGNVHPNPHNGSNLVPTGSSSQGTSRERFMHFPLYQPPVEPTPPSRSVDGLQRQPSNVVNLRSPAALGERQRNPENEDDFAVPIFSRLGKEQGNGAHQSSNIEERGRDSSSSCPVRKETVQVENANSRQDRQCQDHERRKAFVSGAVPTVKISADISVRESSDGALKIPEDSATSGHVGVNRTSMTKYTNINNRYSDYSPSGSINEAERRIALRLKSSSPLGPSNRDKFDRQDEIIQRGDTLPRHIRTDDVSQISMLAAIPDLDMSPDDVVDIIGLKHFFKARKAIVNQQRVFAVQVFELHRLIKVQKLIAKSPEILLEASAFIGNSSIEVPPLKEVATQYALKAFAHSDKHKDDTRSPDHNDKMEGAAESTAARPPTASSPTLTQPSSHRQFLEDPAPGSHTEASQSVEADPKASPWSFPQAGAHQWLVPVMSPSEGLIYKPYPGPGFPDPGFGGCGPPHGSIAPVAPFMNAGYGAPASPFYHHHQGAPFSAQGYFPPYGMSMMSSSTSGPANAKSQVNRPLGLRPNGENSQKASGMPNLSTPNLSTQQQGSCSAPTRKRHSELLGSTGSSPSHVVRAKEKDPLALFPSTSSKKAPQARDDQPNMVIKVVPHNARTATESAARIFRSIQEERQKQQSSS